MRRRTFAIAVVLLGGAALVLFCCGGADRHAPGAPASTPPQGAAVPAEPTAPTSVPAPTTAPAAASAEPAPAASLTATATSATAPAASSNAPGGASIVQAVKSSDPRDLELLAGIERELQRDPPPEVHALIAARKRGASRAELATAIQKLKALELRVLAERWLEKVAPLPR